MSKFVISLEDVDSYSPANHTGTSNQRVISRDTVGARHVEALVGTIVQGHGAQAHAHPTLEQASLILAGEGLGEVDGVLAEFKTGDLMFNPMGKFHKFVTKSETPVKVLVVYAPPYAENPNAAVVYDERSKAAGHIIGAGSHILHPRPDAAFTPDHHDAGTTCHPILNQELAGSRHLNIFEQTTRPGAGAVEHALAATERIFVIQRGNLAGAIDGERFDAQAGDWLFIPQGAACTYQAVGHQPMKAFVVHAYA